MRAGLGFSVPKTAQRVRALDATAITEPGSTGTDWRIHYAIDLRNLQCDFFLLTDVKGGETWRRFPVMKGDIMLGDRGYANPSGVAHVVGAGGEVVVRLNRKAMPLFDKNGKRLNAVHLARRLTPNQNLEWGVWVHTNDGKKIRGRLIVVRRSRQATEYARKKLRQEASKKQKSVSAEALEAAELVSIQADEIDYGTGTPSQERPGELPRLVTRKAVYESARRAHDRGREKVFPLGIRIGCLAGAGGGKWSTCFVKSARQYYPHTD